MMITDDIIENTKEKNMENKENKIENFNTMAGGLYNFQRIYVELTDGVEPCCSGTGARIYDNADFCIRRGGLVCQGASVFAV